MTRLEIWAQWYLAPVAAVCVSVVYLLTSPRSQPFALRLAASAAGFLIAVNYGIAFAIARAEMEAESFGALFVGLQLLPVVAIVQAFRLYRGPKAVHLLQIVNILSLMWTTFIGGMAITGNWI